MENLKRSSLYCAVSIFFFLVTFSVQAQETELEPLLQQLETIRQQNEVAAYAIVITTPDDILIAENRGNPSMDSNRPVSADAYFRVGSITKSFVGLAALIAEQNQLLNIESPATNYIGNEYFKNPWQKESPVTIEQLLQHSAGLPDMSSGEEFNHNEPINNEDGLKLYAKDRTIRWQPGKHYSYSNTGYGLAGLSIEKASQTDINTFLSEQLFKPLNMPSATLDYSEEVQENLVPGFDRDGRTRLPYWHLIFSAFGALNVQPKDMANFLQLYLNRGEFNNRRLISIENMARLEKPTTTIAAREGLDYGYGLGVYNWFYDGHEFFGHGGDGDGYLARFGYSRQAQLGYFVVINRFQHKPLREMQSAIEQWITKDLDPVGFAPRHELKTSSQIIGPYQSVTSRFNRGRTQQLEIFENDGKLFSRINDNRSYELIPVSEHLFRRRNEPTATILIKNTEEGFVFQGDDGNFFKQQ